VHNLVAVRQQASWCRPDFNRYSRQPVSMPPIANPKWPPNANPPPRLTTAVR